MAYVSKEKKAKIIATYKAARLPKTWKITFRVDHHSSIVATIRRAPASVLDDFVGLKNRDPRDLECAQRQFADFENTGNYSVNEFYLERFFAGETLAALTKLKAALNTDNFDNSDRMTDYVHVGHYVTIRFENCEFVGRRKTPQENANQQMEQVRQMLETPVEAVPVMSPQERAEAAIRKTVFGAGMSDTVIRIIASAVLESAEA